MDLGSWVSVTDLWLICGVTFSTYHLKSMHSELLEIWLQFFSKLKRMLPQVCQQSSATVRQWLDKPTRWRQTSTKSKVGTDVKKHCHNIRPHVVYDILFKSFRLSWCQVKTASEKWWSWAKKPNNGSSKCSSVDSLLSDGVSSQLFCI